MSSQDWWKWDATEEVWRAIRTGTAITLPPPDDSDPGIDPDPQARNVLLVTADGTLPAGNQALHDLLVADGWTVTVRPFDAPEDYSDMSVVVLTAGTATDQGRYLYPPVGLVAVDSWRAVGMGTSLGFAGSVNDLEVVDPSSPLAAGYSGTFDAYLSPQFITWNPDTVANIQTAVTRAGQPSQKVVFAFQAGATMPGRYATTRHVGLGFHPDGFAAGLSTESRAQFLASVRWARDTTVVPLPVPDAPSGVSATPGDNQVRLSWTSTEFAESYTVRRATVTGGPYTDLASQVTATTYTDSTAVNATGYFYVVAAVNGSGVSPDSVEVSATPTATATANLSLLVSSAEVSMWRSRATNGPFRTAGDFSANSPGHWTEMVAASTTNWSTARWTGPQELNSDGSVRKLGQTSSQTANDPPGSTQSMALTIASAAYVAVVNDDNQLAQSIVDEIRWYSQQSRLNFNNSTLYPDNHFQDLNPLFIMAIWISSLMKAYDACRVLLPADSDVEFWFAGMASVLHGNLISLDDVFPNRGSDSYASRSSFVDTSIEPNTRLTDGSLVYHLAISKFYNNRRNEMAGVQGLAGLIVGSTFHVEWAKRYVREWLMFANRTTANQWTNGDHNRGSNTYPQGGYQYDFNSLQMLVMFMEALARSGDTSLYDFSSSEGSAHASWGSNHLKTMKEVLQQRIDTVAQTIAAQYTGSGEPPGSYVAGNEFYRIKSRASHTGREIVTDGWLICAAAYYNEPTWVDVVNRVGTPTGFTNPPQSSGPVTGWSVDQRTRFLRSYDSSPFT